MYYSLGVVHTDYWLGTNTLAEPGEMALSILQSQRILCMTSFIGNLMLKLKRSDLCIGTSQAKGKDRGGGKKTLNPRIYLLWYNLAERQFEMMRRGKIGEKYWSHDKKRTARTQDFILQYFKVFSHSKWLLT